ncbi:MAG TPA: RcnB family protein [Dyella sp.]|nr:RcnB family protein [Dyella sp.]
MNKILGSTLLALACCAASTPAAAFQHHGPPGHVPPGHARGFQDRGRHEGWYKKGGRVPVEYRRGTYVVTDWREHHLHAPPRGYEYIRSDNGDFLLVAIATGIIASIIVDH